MLTYTEERDLNLPADEAYHLLLDYFRVHSTMKAMNVRVKHCLEPSHIEIELGGGAYARAIVKVEIFARDRKTRVRFGFNFKREVVRLSIVIISSCAILGIIAGLGSGSAPFGLLISLIWALWFIVIPKSTGYPKERFMDKVDSFLAGVAFSKFPPYLEKEEAVTDPEKLYERLIYAYTTIYGRGKPILDREIESYVKTGLSRKEAIRKLAREKEIG